MPVLSGTDSQRLRHLAEIMPAACRAVAVADAPPERPALAVVTEVVENLVDALVRSNASPRAPVALTRVRPSGRRSAPKTPTFASIHDAWLNALGTPYGRLHGDDEAARQLAEQIRAWQRPIVLATAAPFRLCFRLEEPPLGEEEAPIDALNDWHVRYLLQGRDDPSLLLPVADAWTPKGRIASLFRKNAFDAREYLLSALGQAASLCTGVEASLRTTAPEGFTTDASGAHAFLTETAWLLEQAGFGVLLPTLVDRARARAQRLTVKAHVKTPPCRAAAACRWRKSFISTGRSPWAIKR